MEVVVTRGWKYIILVVAPGVSGSGSRYHRPFHVHPRTISLVEKLRSVSRAVVLSPTSERGEDRIIQRTIHRVIIRLAAFANAYQRPLSTAVGKLLRVRETHLAPFSDRKHEQSRPDPYVIRIKVQIRVEPVSHQHSSRRLFANQVQAILTA